MVKIELIPPIDTVPTSVRSVPVIVITSPLAAVVGLKEVIVGAGTQINPASDAVP
ncbi:hypothetical protein D3C87_1028940 [compost metagenome]